LPETRSGAALLFALKGRLVMFHFALIRSAAAALALPLALAAVALPAAAETGVMSHYSALGTTASGRSYSSGDYVAAHKTLPLGSIVKVENLRNGRSATVRIVDRGPYIAGRIIDVTPGVANDLGFAGQGLAPTRITVIGRGGSVGPYDRRGQATSSSDDAPKGKAKSKPVRTASAEPQAPARRKASSGSTSSSESSARGTFLRDGS
jgi:rare lipoprotein A